MDDEIYQKRVREFMEIKNSNKKHKTLIKEREDYLLNLRRNLRQRIFKQHRQVGF